MDLICMIISYIYNHQSSSLEGFNTPRFNKNYCTYKERINQRLIPYHLPIHKGKESI
ncbi:hypothetical protein CAAN1_16S04038 [[Candida] anglica]|uniref:Uncharacterized protein n=1 Tax=[Candida] anglica TaxID=148631 RepID=A0ABP0EA30_9ASCO